MRRNENLFNYLNFISDPNDVENVKQMLVITVAALDNNIENALNVISDLILSED